MAGAVGAMALLGGGGGYLAGRLRDRRGRARRILRGVTR
jgi:hypothetical protein